MQVFKMLTVALVAAVTMTATTSAASTNSHRNLRRNNAMRVNADWNPTTIMDSDLADAVKMCVKGYESAWNNTFRAANIDAAQEALFSTIYDRCITPVVDIPNL